ADAVRVRDRTLRRYQRCGRLAIHQLRGNPQAGGGALRGAPRAPDRDARLPEPPSFRPPSPLPLLGCLAQKGVVLPRGVARLQQLRVDRLIVAPALGDLKDVALSGDVREVSGFERGRAIVFGQRLVVLAPLLQEVSESLVCARDIRIRAEILLE